MRNLIVIVTILAISQNANAETPVATAARKRQEAVKSIEIVFMIKEVREKDSLTKTIPADSLNVKGPFPDRQISSESFGNKLVIDGSRVHYRNVRTMMNANSGAAEAYLEESTTDATNVKSFTHPESNRERMNSSGRISDIQHLKIAKTLNIYAITASIRGNDEEFVLYPAKDFLPTGRGQKIRGKQCDEYAYQTRSGDNNQVTAYFDPAEDYLLRRLIRKLNGIVTIQIDIEETATQSAGIILPSMWTMTEFDRAGKLTITRSIKVESVKIGNQYADTEFDLKFPVGLDITDQRTQETFLVRDDGTLMKTDRFRSDNPVVLSDAKSNWFQRNAIWLIGAGITLVSCGVLYRIMNRKRLKSAK